MFDPEAEFDDEVARSGGHVGEEEEETYRSIPRSKSIYDDDEFEQSCESWDRNSIYEDILKVRQSRKIFKPVFLKEEEVKKDVVSEKPSSSTPEVFLNLREGGWQVQKIDLKDDEPDFPSLIHSEMKEQKKKPASFSSASKWKNVTTDFFKEEELVEDVPVVVQKKSLPKKSFIGKDGFSTPKRFTGDYKTPSKDTSKEKTVTTGKINPKDHSVKDRSVKNPASANESKPTIDFKNTRMCSYLDKCKRKECSFAHSIEAFQPPECRFGEKCKSVDSTGRITCRFKHVEESKEAFLARSTVKA